jgi:hypothetical protein
LKILFN